MACIESATSNFYDMITCGILNVFSGSELLFALAVLIIFGMLAYYFRLNSTLSVGLGIVLIWAINGLFEVQNQQLNILLMLLIIGLAIKMVFGFKNILEK